MPHKKSSRRRTLRFEDVREIALSMPDVTEATAWGMRSFKAGGTMFAVEPYPRPDVEPSSLGVPIGLEERARLLEARPDVYYLTDHWAKSAGVLVRLTRIRRDELRELLSAAWQHAMERRAAKKARGKAKSRARRGRR